MESKPPNVSSPQDSQTLTIAKPKPKLNNKDFLTHLETYLAKRDGVDKLLKISSYATKIILASSFLPNNSSLTNPLKTFQSNIGISRKAFRLGKFVQDLNALRHGPFNSVQDLTLSIIAYGGEGLYYFIDQFVWLAKSGLIDPKKSKTLQKISAWCMLIGYIGSISLKTRDLMCILEDEVCLVSSIELAVVKGIGCEKEMEQLKKVRQKMLMKNLSIVQDLADGLITLADIRDGKGWLSGPLLLSSAGLLSALISTHKNWVSC